VADLPRYEIVKTKFECRREDADRAVEAIKKEFAKEKVDTQDGIRIDWDNAWVHARASNTEPIMRIIAEAPDRATADAKIAKVQDVVNRTLR
jgi:phosphomannomutase